MLAAALIATSALTYSTTARHLSHLAFEQNDAFFDGDSDVVVNQPQGRFQVEVTFPYRNDAESRAQ